LVSIWDRNDFGKWAFNLRYSAFYIHTTPEDEHATSDERPFSLSQSHGCIHLRPADRDRMLEAGYLAAGVSIRVMGYDAKGPP
jgi:lipoprotein-anchoring transpeptidase ErfK/SrfK